MRSLQRKPVIYLSKASVQPAAFGDVWAVWLHLAGTEDMVPQRLLMAVTSKAL